jgi:hypothetical protein
MARNAALTAKSLRDGKELTKLSILSAFSGDYRDVFRFYRGRSARRD